MAELQETELASANPGFRRLNSKQAAMAAVAISVVLLAMLSAQPVYQAAFTFGSKTSLPFSSLEAIPSVEPPPRADIETADTAPLYFPPLENPPVFTEFQTAERLNILLLGSDRRPDEQHFPRTDSLMVVSWNRTENVVDLLSLPRDLWVNVPGNQPTKINLVYSIGENEEWGGGVPLLMRTMEALISQPIHHYLWIDFSGFEQIIDRLGGVSLYVPQDILDAKYPTADYGYEVFELNRGQHLLDGATALKYARTRTQDGDYNRIRRQQHLMRALIRHVTNPANSGRLLLAGPDILRTVRTSFQSDLSIPELLSLGREVTASPQMGTALVVDIRWGEEEYSDEGMWVLTPRRDELREELRRFFLVSQIEVP